jgi:hypothetical protein
MFLQVQKTDARRCETLDHFEINVRESAGVIETESKGALDIFKHPDRIEVSSSLACEVEGVKQASS